MHANQINVHRDPADSTWTATVGPEGPSRSALTPVNALCALLLALDSAKHPFDPNWKPDHADPAAVDVEPEAPAVEAAETPA